MTWFFAAFSLGLLGSFHCIGMCGPIALALPIHQLPNLKKYLSIILYNIGRASTYAMLGLFFGLLGQGFFMGGFQQTLSVTLGVAVLLSIILPSKYFPSFLKFKFLQRGLEKLKMQLRLLFGQKGLPVLFLIGLLNGLLPCGLVYLGIAGAMATGNYINGAIFMFVFGLGTVPVMLSVSVFGQFISLKYRNKIRQSVPIMVSIMAVLLILRGLNLGIPYVSPRIVETQTVGYSSEANIQHKIIKCCPKPPSVNSSSIQSNESENRSEKKTNSK